MAKCGTDSVIGVVTRILISLINTYITAVTALKQVQ